MPTQTENEQKPVHKTGKTYSSVLAHAKVALEYVAVGFFNFIVTMFVLDLWGKSFSTPWSRGGDGDLPLIMVRSMEKTGWVSSLPHMGAPGTSNIHDLPQGGENLQWLTMKIIVSFTNAAAAVNIYFVLTFIAISMAAYGAAKWWGLSRPTAFVIATIYAFLSYHFFRNEQHLLLSMYAFIPLVLVYSYKSTNEKVVLAKWKWVLFVIVASSTNSYYTIFSLLMIATALLFNLINHNRESLKQHLIVMGSIGFVFILNLVPDILFVLNHGQNKTVSERSYDESETFGLQLTNLFVPRSGHRIDLFSRVGNIVQNAGIHSEQGQSLGIISALGVISLLLYGFYKLVQARKLDVHAHYFFILVVVMMLVTVSSGPTLLGGMAGFRYIRSWNRVDIIIAFIGLLFAGYLFETLIAKKKVSRVASIIALIVILGIAIFDQTTPRDRFPINAIKNEQASECTLVRALDAQNPKYNRAFDLPFVAFPEVDSVKNLGEYQQALVTLCNSDLHVSFGAVRGRNDSFQRDIALKYSCATDEECQKIEHNIDGDIEKLRKAKFSVLIVYRAAYPDSGLAVESILTKRLGEPIVSRDNSQFAYIIDADRKDTSSQ